MRTKSSVWYLWGMCTVLMAASYLHALAKVYVTDFNLWCRGNPSCSCSCTRCCGSHGCSSLACAKNEKVIAGSFASLVSRYRTKSCSAAGLLAVVCAVMAAERSPDWSGLASPYCPQGADKTKNWWACTSHVVTGYTASHCTSVAVRMGR